ncbi:MAG TPA: sel1 repeat family protein, partial [Candidatus Pullichristensenella excrementigallinarum]|nr:sel1 repeat family protein [Candidatus Pullichristensenella excrementigallinarum]
RDDKTAVSWYQKAADAGNATAMSNLGYCYENGYGVEQNYEMALEWYQKALNAGKDTSEAIARVEELLSDGAQPQSGGEAQAY